MNRTNVLTVLGLAFATAVAFLLWSTHRAREGRALRDMPAAMRRDLFARTRQAILAVCVEARPAGLDRYCSQQGSFLLSFDECDASCRELVQRSSPLPTR